MNAFDASPGRRRRTDPKISKETITRIVLALNAGESNDWIIKNIGTCRATITRLVKKYGISRKAGWKGGKSRKVGAPTVSKAFQS